MMRAQASSVNELAVESTEFSNTDTDAVLFSQCVRQREVLMLIHTYFYASVNEFDSLIAQGAC